MFEGQRGSRRDNDERQYGKDASALRLIARRPTHPVVVDNFCNDSEFARRWAIVDQNHTANLDESLKGGRFGLRVSVKRSTTVSCGSMSRSSSVQVTSVDKGLTGMLSY